MTCQACKEEESYIHFGEERLCLPCYNQRMTEELGVEATSYPEGVAIRGGKGEVHHFKLRKRLDPVGVIMEAVEQGTEGYYFQIYGDLHGDQGELLLQLMAKVEKGMAEIYIEEKKYLNGQPHYSLCNDRFAGRVEWNRADRSVPLLVVDGKTYTWKEIGKLLLHYEGFQVKLEILEPAEEINWHKDEVEKEQGQ